MPKAVLSAALAALQFETVLAHDSEKLILTDIDQDRTLTDVTSYECNPEVNKQNPVWIDAHWTPLINDEFRGSSLDRCKARAKVRKLNWILVPETDTCYLGKTRPYLIKSDRNYMVDNESGTIAAYGCFKKNSKLVPPYDRQGNHGDGQRTVIYGKYQLDESWKWTKIYKFRFSKRKAECKKAAQKAELNWVLMKNKYWACYLGEGQPKLDEDKGKEAYVGRQVGNFSPKKPVCSIAEMRFCDEKEQLLNDNFSMELFNRQDVQDCLKETKCRRQE